MRCFEDVIPLTEASCRLIKFKTKKTTSERIFTQKFFSKNRKVNNDFIFLISVLVSNVARLVLENADLDFGFEQIFRSQPWSRQLPVYQLAVF